MLKKNGPLLLASNHPNSFLDAIIFDILFEQPIWSLARGDVFKNKLISRVLGSLKMFPVYRVSEGVENLNSNYETFKNCKALFRKKGIVLIFSEGKCINEWHLRPLKKGTARLAISSWEENIPLEVLPVGINYSSFRRFGKNVIINFGDTITREDISFTASEGIRYQAFNNKLQQQLNSLVFEINKQDKEKKQALLEKKPSGLSKIVFAFPAFIGWLTHLPLYLPVQKITYKKTADNDHFDSIMAAVLLVTYPLYLLFISLLTFYLTTSTFSFLLLFFLPFTAWCYVQIKPQLDK
jgi:1-acyl-sn-glycerol-3-phosphate acyltransferase